MSPLHTADIGWVHDVRRQFADLICADPDLTRAEFHAIIEGSWGSEGRPSQPADARAASGRGPVRAPVPAAADGAAEGGARAACAPDLTRPRSPPADAAASPPRRDVRQQEDAWSRLRESNS